MDIFGRDVALAIDANSIRVTAPIDPSQRVSFVSLLENLDVNPGEPVLLDDGKLELKIIESNNRDAVICEIVHGGSLKPRKGINLPSTAISLPCITPKDAQDLEFALTQDVDWIGLSFVRNASDIHELRALIQASGRHARIVAKIERDQGFSSPGGLTRRRSGGAPTRGCSVLFAGLPRRRSAGRQRALKELRPGPIAE